ncbi:MAG: phenylalanine--tRNA ligase subunit alpha [Bdellovibrionales bacterium]|nr:phenylalanine--tRNA ligase subunit alpha [Bdellovibrionales bacterium]
MTEDLQSIERDFSQSLEQVKNLKELEELRVRFLGKKGTLTLSLRSIGSLPASERPGFGEEVNQLRRSFEDSLTKQKSKLEDDAISQSLSQNCLDVTMPGRKRSGGSLHPLRQVENELVKAFQSLGFSVETGPEIETDFYNFEALNFPQDHPARDMQDTFFLSDGRVLRTHTSPVQVRLMESKKPPLQVIVPGRVYRHDSDVTHSPVFHQVEGLCVGPDVSFAHLKGSLEAFVKMIFGSNAKVRFRPSFFPFTEPSAEIDVMGPKGWMEILGCGMVDPNVFQKVGASWEERGEDSPYDPEEISGFAFGIGVERIAMILHGIDNIKSFYENDQRFLSQFV